MNNFSLRIKTCLAGLCLAVLAATVIDVPLVEAQTYTDQPDRTITRPPARITVEPVVLRCRDRSSAGRAQIHRVRPPCGLVFDAYERGAKHWRARGLA
jgi:hypothetical protein